MIRIITDTTACLPVSFARERQIQIIPQIVTFGNESYYDDTQIDNATFMAKLKASKELPKTAAPPPELFIEKFQELSQIADTILCIHPSAEVSGTVRAALIAAKEFPETKIHVIDTRVVSSPIGTMVQLASDWALEGLDSDTIIARLESLIKRCRVYFLVATLEYLAKGGRIGGASALLGSVLQIKPILTVHDGRVDRFENERTSSRALNRLKEIVSEQIPHDGSGYLTVMHAGVPEKGAALARELASLVNQSDVPVFDVPPAIITHGGPGILGAGFFTAS